MLDRLIAQGLESNLALQQEQLSLRRSRAALAQARGRFLPTLDLSARYTRADGGRSFTFPAGDLLNPVYSTLNQMLQQQGQEPRFSSVQNQEFNFIREREQDTRLELRQPLFAPRAYYGYRAQQHDVAARSAAVETYRRELVRDIQTAYFNYRKAQRRVDVLQAAETIVTENRRTNQRLYAAERVTQDAVYRAEAEVLEVQQQVEEAQADREQARRYLNFLLNRPAQTPVPAPEHSPDTLVARRTTDVLGPLALSADTARSPAPDTARLRTDALLEARPELDRLRAAIDATADQRRLDQSAFLPRVSLAVDAGIQGSTYGVSEDERFYLASVVLSWNLFNGFRDDAAVERSRLETQRLRTRREEVTRRLELELREAVDDVRVAQRSLRTARARVRAARESFRMTERRYEEGRANLVTYTDARTTMTQAELNLAVTRYTLLTRLAQLEFAAGLSPLPDTGL